MRSSPGLLLFEAAVTVVIVAVALVFLTQSFGAGLRAMGQARRYAVALRVAEQELGRLELEGEINRRLPTDRSGDAKTSQGTFTWRAEVSPFSAPHEQLQDPARALDRLTVRVEESQGEAPVRISLTTLVPRVWSASAP